MTRIGLFFIIALMMVFAFGTNGELKCGPGQVLDECPNNCPPGRACIQVCRPACVCRPNHIMIEDRECVPV